MPKHFNITIHGRVQGVGFRRAARDHAHYWNIKGFVKNTSDGLVYIEAEGDENSLSQFIQWCHQGPPFARVKEVDVLLGNWIGFTVFETRF